ncbi:MAG TPA: hypothetical protein VF493_17395, partial [Terriglobales bacterium]
YVVSRESRVTSSFQDEHVQNGQLLTSKSKTGIVGVGASSQPVTCRGWGSHDSQGATAVKAGHGSHPNARLKAVLFYGSVSSHSV